MSRIRRSPFIARALVGALAVATLAPAAVSTSQAHEVTANTYDTIHIEDIQYGSAINARGQVEDLYLDIFLPASGGDMVTDSPALVFAHGGSFKNGHRKVAEIAGYVERMAENGYATATINYRLRPVGTEGSKPNHELIVEAAIGDSDTLRDAHHDMLAAVRYLRANAATYGIDADRIAVGGSSAGAVTALQAAINTEDPGTSGTPDESSEVAAAIAVSGAADPDHIEAGDPPFLMFHGAMDTTVPAALGYQACAINTALLNGCEMVHWADGGHTPWGQWEDDVVERSVDFLCRTMMSDRWSCGHAPAPFTEMSL